MANFGVGTAGRIADAALGLVNSYTGENNNSDEEEGGGGGGVSLTPELWALRQALKGGGSGDDSGGGGGGGTGYGSYGWIGGAGGGYGSSKSAEMETQAKNYNAISDFSMQATKENFENQLESIRQNIEGNKKLAEADKLGVSRAIGDDWFKRQQQLQSSVDQMINNPRMSSSIIPEIISGVERAKDQSNSDAFANLTSQWNDIEKTIYQAQLDDVNRQNTALNDFIRDMKDQIVQYYTTMSNMDPDYLNEYQYWIDILNGEEDPNETLKAIMDGAVNLPQRFQDMLMEFKPYDQPELNQYKWLLPDTASFNAKKIGNRGSQNTASSANSDYYRALGSDYANRKVE
jgi:hypothetical protein